jgi:hypothetical protein
MDEDIEARLWKIAIKGQGEIATAGEHRLAMTIILKNVR